MPQLEVLTFVVYDIANDGTRNKVAEKCKDFGLVRFQYSAFEGLLTRNRREELALVLEKLMEAKGGKATLIPICQADCHGRIDLKIEPSEPEDNNGRPKLNVFTGEESS